MTNAQNIGRKRKKNGFTQIANNLFEDSKLSWKAKGILCYLLSRPNNWKINKTDLQNKAIEGRDAVQSGLNELKELGYLHIYPNKNEKGQIDSWIWEYDDTPFLPTIRENQTTENPQETGENMQIFQTTENPVCGKSSVWDSSIYNNTDFKNTDINNNKTIVNINNSPKKTKKNSNSSELESEFELLWQKYPRKIGRAKALQSFIKARKSKKYTFETIEFGLNKYLEYIENQGTDEQFIAHFVTWLNQERFNDDYICTAKKKKPNDDVFDFMKREYGGRSYERAGNGDIIDYDTTDIPQFF